MLSQAQTRYGNMVFFQNDDPIGACLTHYGEWAQQEIDLLSSILSKDSIVMDVGANIGTHSLFFAKHCSEGHVICFEPQHHIFKLLTTNLTINLCFNTTPIQAGVSDSNGSIRMLNNIPDPSNRTNYGEFRLNNDSNSGLYTEIYKLDKYLNDIPRLDLIKLDVEGMECKVLDGARQIIEKFRPFLFLEFSEKEGNDALLEKIDSLGYDSYLFVYPKHNPQNFNSQNLNVWEESNFILSKDTMHKRYDASLLCFHKELNITTDLQKATKGTSLFNFLFERALI